MMGEGQRQAYLGALGIPLWTSRQPLPFAAPAEPLERVLWLVETDGAVVAEVESAAPESVNLQQAVIETAPVMPREIAPALPSASEPPQRESYVAAVKTEAVVAKPAVEAPTKAAEAAARFAFYAVSLSPQLVALVSLADDPDLGGREHSLLASIHAAFSEGSLTLGPQFRFPIVDNPRLGRDATAAQQAVSGFLMRYRDPAIRFLVLGEELKPYLERVDHRIAHATVRLSLLLADPVRKKALWQALST